MIRHLLTRWCRRLYVAAQVARHRQAEILLLDQEARLRTILREHAQQIYPG